MCDPALVDWWGLWLRNGCRLAVTRVKKVYGCQPRLLASLMEELSTLRT
jgi:hypothetical protein